MEKTKWRMMQAALTLCAAFGWWGALYPQFTLLKGTYEIVCEEESGMSGGDRAEEPDGGGLYWDILNADSSRIRFKSRLLTDWNAFKEHRREEIHESEDQ
ncbi:MAG: hypothetical protein NC399_10595 [Muribaculum sp.]|nr:hypothetical protein [Muribaculum sp.]